MNVFQKIFSAPIVGMRWINALDAASHENYQEALIHLDYLDNFFKRKRIEYHLLRGLVNYGLDNDSEAVQNFEISVELLNNSNRYKEDERNYLLSYAEKFGNKALRTSTITKTHKPFPHIDIASISLSNVRGSLKKSFPLRDHPAWD